MILYDEITRLRAPQVTDGYGNQSRDWANASSATFSVQWSAQTVNEVIGDEPRTITRIKIFGDQWLDLEATDRVLGPDGNTYEIDGEIQRSYRRGQLHHVRAYLKRIATTD